MNLDGNRESSLNVLKGVPDLSSTFVMPVPLLLLGGDLATQLVDLSLRGGRGGPGLQLVRLQVHIGSSLLLFKGGDQAGSERCQLILGALDALLLEADAISDLIVKLLPHLLLLVPLSLVELDALLSHGYLLLESVDFAILEASQGLRSLQVHLQGVNLSLYLSTIPRVVTEE